MTWGHSNSNSRETTALGKGDGVTDRQRSTRRVLQSISLKIIATLCPYSTWSTTYYILPRMYIIWGPQNSHKQQEDLHDLHPRWYDQHPPHSVPSSGFSCHSPETHAEATAAEGSLHVPREIYPRRNIIRHCYRSDKGPSLTHMAHQSSTEQKLIPHDTLGLIPFSAEHFQSLAFNYPVDRVFAAAQLISLALAKVRNLVDHTLVLVSPTVE